MTAPPSGRRAQAVGRIAAEDLDEGRLPRIDQPDDVGAVGAVQRETILEHEDATLDWILLQSRSANLNTRLIIRSEEALDDHAGSRRQGVGERHVGGGRDGLGRHEADAARCRLGAMAGCL